MMTTKMQQFIGRKKRQEVGDYVKIRRRKYNILSLSIAVLISLIPSFYMWSEGTEIGNLVIMLLILTGVIYAAIRFVDRLVLWVACALELGAIGTLMWQVYVWLREGYWLGLSVEEALSWLGVKPSYLTVEGWVGVSKIVNATFMWVFDLALPMGCFLSGLIMAFIAGAMESLDIPKTEGEEEI